MHQCAKKFIFLSAITFSIGCYASIDPSKLIKVTSQTNPACIEYYNFKNEMYCSTTALQARPVDPDIKNYEHQNIVFDERLWFAAWGQHTETMDTVEYIPAGDDINKWNELVTSQFMPDPGNTFTPKQFVDVIVQGIKNTGFTSDIHYLKETPTQITFEFQILSPANQIQDELQTVKRDTKGLYILHYVIKQADMGIKNRVKWIANFEKSNIKER